MKAKLYIPEYAMGIIKAFNPQVFKSPHVFIINNFTIKPTKLLKTTTFKSSIFNCLFLNCAKIFHYNYVCLDPTKE